MTVKAIKSLWDNGILIVIISVIESTIKLSFSTTELVLGHLRNASPNESRIFIHSIMFTVFGAFGIICSALLYDGLTKNKNYSRIIYWICLQGISIFHQIFFSIEIVLIFHYHFKQWGLNFVIIITLLLYISMEIKFLIKIVVIYQKIEEKEAPPNGPRVVSSWRIPTISELLGDEGEIGNSTPPIWTLTNASNNNESNA
ncbi:hypothetical protein PVAND_011033 [Polypedilum vanderplanki]|uniref:Uncharacterized protein n=1 Tax=Polypedilum vanderplanki TaxID=319348 RepID=A0A9J6CHE7_POLVA|nr:hypothetical protein PVAND_011033 [Polypedilum vanderplanki]